MSSLKEDAMADLHYSTGFRAGWNAALNTNGEEIAESVAQRRMEALKVMREASIMEVCHDCLKANHGTMGSDNLIRCRAHLDLPEGSLGAVFAMKLVNPQTAGE